MKLMQAPVGAIAIGERSIVDDQEVFRIGLLSRPGEIKRSGDHRVPIDDHDFVMRNAVGGVDEDRNRGVSEEGRERLPLAALGLIEDRFDLHASLMGVDQRLGDGA